MRPYPAKTAGVPLRFQYEINSSEFTFEWVVPEGSASATSPPLGTEPSVNSPPRTGMPPLTTNRTEIFLPWQLTHDRTVVVQGLAKEDRWAYDEARQTLTIVAHNNAPGTVHRVKVGVRPLPKPAFVLNDFWSDFGDQVLFGGFVLLSVLVFLLSRWLA